MKYMDIVARRRQLRIPGYATLAEVGLDGDYVSPYQITARSKTGPALVAYNWIDADSVATYRPILQKLGYLPNMQFNKVLDIALGILGISRTDTYVTQAFHLLPRTRSQAIPAADIDLSFAAVTRHELEGRSVVALGSAASAACARHGIKHVAAPHPSARIGTHEDKASQIASAIRRAMKGFS